MKQNCIVLTKQEKDQEAKIVESLKDLGYSEERLKNAIRTLYSNNKIMPSEDDVKSLLEANTKYNWSRTSDNSYEVSTAGDKRFSALYATFKEGTIIDGEDVGGKTIEWVYQNIIKKSGKGKAPSKDSKLFIPSREGYKGDITPSEDTIFVFGSNPEGRHGAGAARVAKDKFGAQYGVGEGLTGNAYALPTKDLRIKENRGLRSIPKESIIESIKTLYKVATENQGKQFKVAFRNKLDETTLNGYTGEEMIDMFLSAGPIPSNIIFSEEWLNTGKFNLSKQEIEDFSYEKGYLPLWQEWAKQNPKFIEALRKKAKGKTLTDKFATTRVSQARALADILNQSINSIQQDDAQQAISEDTDSVQTLKERIVNSSPKLQPSQQDAIDLVYSPITRRNRVNMLSQVFMEEAERILEEKKQEYSDNIKIAKSNKEREQLERQQKELTLFSALVGMGPKGVFNRMRNNYRTYVEQSKEQNVTNKVQEITDLLETQGDLADYTEEQIKSEATRRVEYDTVEFDKMTNNDNVWNALCEEACAKIAEDYGIQIDFTIMSNKQQEQESPNFEGLEDPQEGTIEAQEDATKENWMTGFRFISSYERLSQKTRAAIRNIVKTDIEGYAIEDDLGIQERLDAQQVHAFLIEKLRFMLDPSDMIPLLEKEVSNYPWVQQIIEELQEDEVLFSQFYHDFRKDYTDYWVQIVNQYDNGVIKTQTKKVSNPSTTTALINRWRANYEEGLQLDELSIYNKNSELNKDNAKQGLAVVEDLQNKTRSLNPQQTQEFLQNETNQNRVLRLLHMVGIHLPTETMVTSLINTNSKGDLVSFLPKVLKDLHIIFDGVQKGTVINTDTNEEGDLINHFSKVYTDMANIFKLLANDVIESNIREGGKTRYCHTTPSYIGKIIANLKAIHGDEKRFEDFINKEFKQYDWFYNKATGKWRNKIIQQIVENKSMRNILSHNVLLSRDKIEYSDMDDLTYTLALIENFYATKGIEKKTAWYSLPILADAPSAEFIKFRRYSGTEQLPSGKTVNYKEAIIEEMIDLVEQEYNRIMLVRQRDNEYYNNKSTIIQPIANFDIIRDKEGNIKNYGGSVFKFIPELNDYRINEVPFIDYISNLISEGKDITGDEFRDTIRQVLTQIMGEKVQRELNRLEEIGVYDTITQESKENKNSNILYKYFNTSKKETVDNLLEEYVYNTMYFTSQIIQVMTTDLAYYKNMEDFQKRFKEVHAPGLRLNTEATWDGVRVGKETERTIYLADDIIKSSSLDIIKAINNVQVKAGLITQEEADNRTSKFEEVNVADAQAYRSLPSYRAIQCMIGNWTQESEESFKRILAGKQTQEDFNTIWQIIKPFMYTQVSKSTNVVDSNGDIGNMKVPVQHKNSEFPLLAIYNVAAATIGQSERLKAINEFMLKYNIDVVQFESTTKVGKQGVIDISNLHTKEEILKHLEKETGYVENKPDPNIVHEVPYADYSIQTATPEHFLDIEQLIGTQPRKLVTADLPNDAVFTLPSSNKTITKQEWLGLYNALTVENLIDDYEVYEEFKDPNKVTQLIQEEIRKNSRYGRELAKACALDDNGNINIPYFDVVQSQRIQTLLHSIIKSRITKQKIKGGALIQVSGFGTDLHMVFKDKDGNLLDWRSYKSKNKNATRQEYEQFVLEAKEKGDLALDHLEVYMPAYSKEFIEPLLKEDGILDPNLLPEELRRFVGYRVPTEDKYSMAPLRIKGFLPMQNGSSILLPAEITTLAGSDFDVDKMYVMFREFTIEYYDKAKAKHYYEKETNYSKKFLNKLFTSEEDSKEVKQSELAEGIQQVQETFDEWFEVHKGEYKLDRPIIKTIKYNHNKTPQENTRQQRNNLMIDLIESVLTHPSITPAMLNPGGFEPQQKAARLVTILKNMSDEQLKDIFTKEGVFNQKTHNNIREYLLELPLDLTKAQKAERVAKGLPTLTLESLASKVTNSIDPLLPSTQITFHRQNMVGGKLIGIFANHNASHAVVQQLETFGLKEPITLNNKSRVSLNEVSVDNINISRNNAGWLSASVDDVKAKVLSNLNQNTFTANVTMLLSRLGYNPTEIGLFMTQPIVEDIYNNYVVKSREGVEAEVVINQVLKVYKGLSGNSYSKSPITLDFLVDGLREDLFWKTRTPEQMSQLNPQEKDLFYAKQLNIGYAFLDFYKKADALNNVVQAYRADTQGGAAGPTIADTELKILKVEGVHKASKAKTYPLVGVDFISRNLLADTNQTTEEIREKLLNSRVPFLQAFYTLGVEGASKMLQPYFPQFNSSIKRIVRQIQEITVSERLSSKLLNNIYNELFTYALGKNPTFGNRFDGNNVVSSQEVREYYIKHFPSEFLKLKSESKELSSNDFIQNLVVKTPKKSSVKRISFSNVGQLTTALSEKYTRDWASLMYSENPQLRQLALDLFVYSYFSSGLAFGASSFAHLAPVSLRKSVVGYTQTLWDLLEKPNTFELQSFVDQYIRNHLNNKQLVPTIETKLTKEQFNTASTDIVKNKEFIKKFIYEDGQKIPILHSYIKIKFDKETHYYKTIGVPGFQQYIEIEPLGINNLFVEYSYSESDVTSVFNEQERSRSIDFSKEEERFLSNDTPSSQLGESTIKYETPESFVGLLNEELNEIVNFSNNVSSELLEELAEANAYMKQATENIISSEEIAEAYNLMESKGDMGSLHSNETTDANGKKTC